MNLIEVIHQRLIKLIPGWPLFALLGFFTLSGNVASSPAQQRTPVQTEQCDEARSIRRHLSFSDFFSPCRATFSSAEFPARLSFCANSIRVRLKSREDHGLLFPPIAAKVMVNFLPRSSEFLLSNQG